MASKKRTRNEEQNETRNARRRFLRAQASRSRQETNRRGRQRRERQQEQGEETDTENARAFVSNGCAPARGVENEHYFDVGNMNIECRSCKALHFLGERKTQSSASNPVFSACCESGKLTSEHIEPLVGPPELLKELLTGTSSRDKRFRTDIIKYNNALCMASVEGSWVSRGEGSSHYNPTVTLQGRLHHFIGPAQPAQGRRPAFLSVYFYDADIESQTDIRAQNTRGLNRGLVTNLAAMLNEHNGYVRSFLSLREWASSTTPMTNYKIVIHADKKPANEHIRRYNGPSCSEVAALIPGNEDGLVGKRDIVVRRRGSLNRNGNESLDKVNVSHRSYDPLSYVMLFPSGQNGWHHEMKFRDGTKERKITPMLYYKWRLFQRRNEFNTILRACRLFQQYLVDQYCKIEAERLSYLAFNQHKIRAENYTALREQLGDSGGLFDESEAVRSGRLVILPSTFVGGERYMRQKMHDIIAISNKLGHPDIFLTMTCNPKWKEIQNALYPGQSAKDRPDLCARVFRLKLKALMQFVVNQKLFGNVVAQVRVIEFQKRGLPHAHCIFILDSPSKNALRNPSIVDTKISAEIPDESEPVLRAAVLQHMIHNPCGTHNPGAVCMGESGCKKRFPKPFKTCTEQSESDYYITYMRRSPANGGNSAIRPVRGNRNQVVDNSWVVPYNPVLMRMFECHLNVELCVSRVGGIKYLFKYICKGSDRVTMQIAPEITRHNEIELFQDARYVSASEAVWRILGFDIVDHKPNVVRLEVHTEGHHTVYFREGQEQAAAQREDNTKLTAWFEANKIYSGARHVPYVRFPEYFTWQQSTKMWKPRAVLRRRRESARSASSPQYCFDGPGESVVGRLYTVSPREGERYYLRMLLLHVSGARSFEEIRTVDGKAMGSFREACSARGLLTDDVEWRKALRQSFASQFVPLSHVFATILAFCNPSDPLRLWNEHKSLFISDIRLRHRGQQTALRDENIAVSYVLLEIQESLNDMGGFDMDIFHLPSAPEALPALFEEPDGQETEQLRLAEAVTSSIARFNDGQRAVFDAVVGAVLPGVSSANVTAPVSAAAVAAGNSDRLFFLDAPGGTGKTFVTRAIHSLLRIREKKVVAVATSAVAAVLLDDGRTAHSAFKIKIPCSAEDTCTISVQSQLAQDLREVDLIIWDEVVMCHRYNVEAVDRTLRDLTNNKELFGGKCVLFSGDFRQILPVIQGGSRAQIVHACIKSSALFGSFKCMRLTENMRLRTLREDPNAPARALEFPEYLLRLGEGRLPSPDGETVELPESVNRVTTVEDLCSAVFGEISSRSSDVGWLTSRAILSTKNVRLQRINRIVGDRMPGSYKTFLSADTVVDEDENALKYPVELLNTLTAGSALPDHELQLKKGFMVMLLRNICPQKGHVNGARYTVEHMTNNVLHLRVAVGAHKGARLTLPRMPCGPGDENFPVPGFRRTQFPVRVCFGMTVNKAQGQSFGGKLGPDQSDECFAHGQLYVGLSRVTDPRNLTVCLERQDKKTRNVVYREALSNNF